MLPITLSLNSFCDETSRTWVSLNLETRCVISIKRVGSSPNLSHLVSWPYKFWNAVNFYGASQVALVIKKIHLPMQEIKDRVFYPWVGKIPWKRKWQPIPVFLAWKIPWTEEPGSLQSIGSQRVIHNWVYQFLHKACLDFDFDCNKSMDLE